MASCAHFSKSTQGPIQMTLCNVHSNFSWQETLRAMERLVDIFRRATTSTSGAKNPLTAGAAERREWQYEDADASNHAEVCRSRV